MISIEKKLWDIEWGEQSVSIWLLLNYDKELEFLDGWINIKDNLDNQMLGSRGAFAKSLSATNNANIAYFVNRIAPHKVVETGYFMSTSQFVKDWIDSRDLLNDLSKIHEVCRDFNTPKFPEKHGTIDMNILGNIVIADNKTGISVEIESDTCATVPQNNVTVSHTENCDITFNGREHFDLILKIVEDTKIII